MASIFTWIVFLHFLLLLSIWLNNTNQHISFTIKFSTFQKMKGAIFFIYFFLSKKSIKSNMQAYHFECHKAYILVLKDIIGFFLYVQLDRQLAYDVWFLNFMTIFNLTTLESTIRIFKWHEGMVELLNLWLLQCMCIK
jgi:hypothetical protein